VTSHQPKNQMFSGHGEGRVNTPDLYPSKKDNSAKQVTSSPVKTTLLTMSV